MRKAIVIALAVVLVAVAGALPAMAGPVNGAALPRADVQTDRDPGDPQVSNVPGPRSVTYSTTPAANNTYEYYETLAVAVEFSEAVLVTGSPYLELLIGSAVKKAFYHEGSGTTKLLFQYRVEDGDNDPDGFSVRGTDGIKLNGGRINSTAHSGRAANTYFSYTVQDGSVVITRTVTVPANNPMQKVYGINSVPSFGSASVDEQRYTPDVAIPVLDLPAATGGDGALTYGLNMTRGKPPCGSASGTAGASGASVVAIPSWMNYHAPGTTYKGASVTGGGKIVPDVTNKPKDPMSACFELYARDADRDTSTGDRAELSFSVIVLADYDGDNDGLIDVDSLAKLNAIRWDLDGNGSVSSSDKSKYDAAFPNAVAGMGCKLVDHDDNAVTAQTPVCTGYELTANLDFDENNDGRITSADDDYWNSGKGWQPIGDRTTPFTATFDGNGNTLSNLFIKDPTNNNRGLFGVTGTGCQVERLGLRNVNVTGYNNVGGLVGRHGCAISSSYATGSVTGNFSVGGLVGRNGGTISASYAAVSVTGSHYAIGGLAGRIAADAGSAISASYATGSVTGGHRAGGLVGRVFGGTITASYATGPVTGTERVGGLVGEGGGAISTSYATGSVTGGRITGGLVGRLYGGNTVNASYATGSVTSSGSAGGLVGWLTGAITNSYAIGAVKGTGNDVGGLVGFDSKTFETGNVVRGTATNSYWDTGTTGQATSLVGTGKTTRDLQSPTGYSDIYAAWNTNPDGVAGNDDPWDFGTNRQYPVLKYGGLDTTKQRQTSIQSDNWNAPVVGEPVVAKLNVTLDTGSTSTWEWQNSTDGSSWSMITVNAASATYIPVTADVGKYLRAKVSFTASGSSQTLTTVNTAKVVAATTASAGTAATAVAMVGKQLSYQHASVTAAGTANRTAWRWQRCDNAAMTANCVHLAASTTAIAEYTPVAGDVGKYLRAYAYYADSANSDAWTRTQTPVLGPVVAVPTTSP